MNEYVSFIDIFLCCVLLICFYFYGSSRKNRLIETEPYYRYFLPGLFVKVLGGLGLCFVYLYYYEGGDTLAYFHDNKCISRLFMENPAAAFKFTFGQVDQQLLSSFDSYTDYPVYLFDSHAIYVVKITWILSLITFNSYLGQTMLISLLSFLVMWRLYKMFIT